MKIIECSNVIQYDVMGYPLRLYIVENRKMFRKKTDQVWIDTVEREGDVVLRWGKVDG